MKYIVTLNGNRYEVEVEAVGNEATRAEAPAAPVKNTNAVSAGSNAVSPMPGTILEVKTSVGASVKAGDVLFVLEAMKMENDIVSPVDGTVKQINVTKGATVATDEVLAVIG
jgi:biotin carboxyl carrier protein